MRCLPSVVQRCFSAAGSKRSRIVSSEAARKGGFFFLAVKEDKDERRTTVGATYSAAQSAGLEYGFSKIFSARTGGVGTAPSSPASLAGMQSFLVPEPSIYALLALGGAAMFIRRRR